MKQIILLDQETIDQIAAGEVVERPASVVKELTENAVDAGATAVTIEVRDGGISFIRITDNGEGIPAQQIRTAFMRHATSKITTAADLSGVATLGFRGEALSSISSVSRMELITKTPGSLIGSRYLIEGGQEVSFDEIGAPEGSTMLVKDLFYNTPVRKKFLKSASTEGAYVNELVEHLALSHPEISFKLIMGGQVKLHTSGNGNLKDVIYGLYGREIAANLLPVEAESEGIRITGFLAKPAVSRGNRNYENYFVAGRYVRDKIIAKAIEEGYRTFMMQHRYPFTALYLSMEGDAVDVNVHPAKREVRFSDNERIYRVVENAVRETLSHRELIRNISADTEREEKKRQAQEKKQSLAEGSRTPEPFEKLRRDYHQAGTDSPYQPKYSRSYSFLAEMDPLKFEQKAEHTAVQDNVEKTSPVLKGRFDAMPAALQERSAEMADRTTDNDTLNKIPEAQQPNNSQMTLFEDGFLRKEERCKHRLIGQLFDTYYLVEYEKKLYIIDQHAAHEKVMYERFVRAYREKTFTSQMISPSLIVTLSPTEYERYKTYEDAFTRVGFTAESFGGNDIAITAVPDNLYGLPDEQLFRDMLDSLDLDVGTGIPEQLLVKLATMACKAAVKGGMPLSGAEADTLIDELLNLENPFNCPHGRPTIISMSQTELEKKFKRIV